MAAAAAAQNLRIAPWEEEEIRRREGRRANCARAGYRCFYLLVWACCEMRIEKIQFRAGDVLGQAEATERTRSLSSSKFLPHLIVPSLNAMMPPAASRTQAPEAIRGR